jgi:hypothetical protein
MKKEEDKNKYLKNLQQAANKIMLKNSLLKQ